MEAIKTNYEKIWSQHWGQMQTHGPVHRHHRRLLQKLVSDLSFESLADLGCGAGQNLAFLLSQYPVKKILGVDVSQAALNQARAVLPKDTEFFCGDITKDARPAGSYDLVICMDVIEHVENDQEFLRAASSMTGEYLVLSTLQGRMREFEKGIGHFRNYRPGELQQKLQNAGFEIDRVIEWGFPWYSPLYRNVLDNNASQRVTGGEFGWFKKTLSSFLYYFFMLNSERRGDIIVVRAKKKRV